MTAPALTLSSCHDIYTAVPYLLGFHPEKSLALLILSDAGVEAAVRFHLPNHRTAERWKADVAEVLGRREATMVTVAAYGTPDEAAFAAQTALSVADACGLEVADVLRVHGDSYSAASCITDGECPLNGHPISPEPARPADGLTARQRRRRATGFARIEPTGRPEPAAWLKPAFDNEIDRLAGLLQDRPDTAVAQIHADAIALFDEHATSVDLTAAQTAGMLIALTHKRVRDHAMMLTDRYGPKATIATWSDLDRQAPAGYAAAPATLRAYAAWRCGDDALARHAIACARADDPAYVMAAFLDQALTAGIPAHRLPAIDALWLADTWTALV
ncbi:DUF4192 domain-containing protein [Phytomonospora endophytica]|uniref:DUF4192 domain-containing protein n=1 Tax=Phytomonospora endophytica TaxID=714109 RepID=A0A841FK73_9ACTN|nr:DUF4192 domain-containing protein [Phytomonospora endophytica]MBB6037731.1 hypothetical protein [Phytomonospora endophytica]GIG67741.1 hypothetical protein Pen01_40360 [Phytomonospora endophytica]